MEVFKLMPILKKYEKCPDCSSSIVGNSQGGIVVEDNTYTGSCKCGFRITVNEDGKEVECPANLPEKCNKCRFYEDRCTYLDSDTQLYLSGNEGDM